MNKKQCKILLNENSYGFILFLWPLTVLQMEFISAFAAVAVVVFCYAGNCRDFPGFVAGNCCDSGCRLADGPALDVGSVDFCCSSFLDGCALSFVHLPSPCQSPRQEYAGI